MVLSFEFFASSTSSSPLKLCCRFHGRLTCLKNQWLLPSNIPECRKARNQWIDHRKILSDFCKFSPSITIFLQLKRYKPLECLVVGFVFFLKIISHLFIEPTSCRYYHPPTCHKNIKSKIHTRQGIQLCYVFKINRNSPYLTTTLNSTH